MIAFWRIEEGDCRELMRAMEPESVQCVVTSPPYWGLRDYGTEGQLGLERTPDEYVGHLVEVFREVRRVLRDDGVVWLNLGDCYATGAGKVGEHPGGGDQGERWKEKGGGPMTQPNRMPIPGLKPKDLVGVPWRVAFTLQQDGWYLRSEVIWAKPNPMPESITDRPTKAHEQVFLLTKSERYFYDAFAIREEDGGVASGNGFERPEQIKRGGPGQDERWAPGSGRNRRSVWSIPTVPFKDAHFATFPPKLVEPCVMAGTPEAGVCVECGAPRQRIVNKVRRLDGEGGVDGGWDQDDAGRIGAGVGHWRFETTAETLGWRPTCACGAPPGIEPDDLELIASPTGQGGGGDPSRELGRAGYLRPRGPGAGTRVMTRYQQRRYAEQLKRVPKTAVAKLIEQGRTTEDAWAHYCRTDRSGARALPEPLLEHLLDDLLDRVEPPEWELPDTRPAVVLDPFSGAGTTGLVAMRLSRSFIGCELSETYAAMSRDRIRDDAPLLNVGAESPQEPA